MATEPGAIDLGITDQAGGADILRLVGFPTTAGTPGWPAVSVRNGELVGALADAEVGGVEKHIIPVTVIKTEPGLIDAGTPGSDWFDRIIVIPKSISIGIVLSVVNISIDIYNSFRTQQHSLDAFVNNVGAGTSIPDLPSLPATIGAQDGLALTFEVLPVGPTTISGTLDFTFDISSASIAVTGFRAIIFPFAPERPMTEKLITKTDVIRKSLGTEQRRAGRLAPRQVFEYTYRLSGADRNAMDTIIMSSQDFPLGLPNWMEIALLQTAVAIDDTSVTVDSTDFADFEVGGVAIMRDGERNEPLEISGKTATTLSFSSPFTKTFPVGAFVMPLKTAFMNGQVRGIKFPQLLQDTTIRFTVVNNDVDISDVSAFPSFNSKVLLTEPNMIRARLSETISRRIVHIDSEVGIFERFTTEAISRRSSLKMFFSRTRQRLWEVRQLLHALKGKQVSFYLPTFFPEFIVAGDIASGSDLLDIKNMGYTALLGATQPRNVIRVIAKDGTTVIRTVLSSVEIDTATERLTVDSAWGVNILKDDVDRVEYIEKVRADSDEITITHLNGVGEATIEMPVITVNE